MTDITKPINIDNGSTVTSIPITTSTPVPMAVDDAVDEFGGNCKGN